MRTREETYWRFWGTHKGADIQIDREPAGRFYIVVTAKNGCHLYDGWAPVVVRDMKAAKFEARRGALLDCRSDD